MKNINAHELQLFNALHESRVRANELVFKKRAFRGVKPNIVDKYAETAHFVYELLQNADDANATEVTIILRHDRLLFKHNGTKHFDITDEEDSDRVGDINSITGIGDSTKEENQNKIGKFGVGFKAVFQYTDTPEIYDDTFKFKIEDLIVPTLIEEDYEDRNEGETLFVLPFRNPQKSFSEIKTRLELLNNPILFLRKLKKITCHIYYNKTNTYSTLEYSKDLLETTEQKDLKFERYRITNASKVDFIFLFSRNIYINDEKGKKQSFPIFVGFYYDNISKKLITKEKKNIYCFFPTKESFKTCFISHAPFLLTENRQNIKRDEEINKKLIEKLSELAVDSVVAIRDYGVNRQEYFINENIIDIIPNYIARSYYSEDDMFEEPMLDAFREMLEYEPIFLSRNNNYLTRDDSYKTTNAIFELLTKDQFCSLRRNSKVVLDEDIPIHSSVDFLKWDLIIKINKIEDDFDLYSDINDYRVEDFGNDISKEFMEEQKLEWVSKFYTFLRNEAPKYWKLSPQSRNTAHIFRNAPIIKTTNDEWVSPFKDTNTPNVFLPLVNNSDTSTDYNFINSIYLQDEMSCKFFDELEIKQPDEMDYIRNVVLKKYDETEDEEVEVDDEIHGSDFNLLLKYYKKVKDTEAEDEFFSNLKDKFYLVGSDSYFYYPNELFVRNNILTQYFDNDAKFFNTNYYKKSVIEYKESFVNEFIKKLGVRSEPYVKEIKYKNEYSVPKHLKDVLKNISYYEFIKVENFILVGFKDAINNNRVDKAISIFLWNDVIPLYFDKFDATIVTRQKYKQYYEHNSSGSTFYYELKKYAWLYDKSGQCKNVSEIFVEDLAEGYHTYNGLTEHLGINKRTQDLREKYNATDEEQKIFETGSKITQAVGDELTEDELFQLIEKAKQQKRAQKLINEHAQKNESVDEEQNAKKSSENELQGESIEEKMKKRWEEKKNRSVNKPNSSNSNSIDLSEVDFDFNNSNSPENNAPFFIPTSSNVKNSDIEDTTRAERNLKSKDTTAQEQAEVAKEQVEIFDLLKDTSEYTFKWFKVLMELMHAGQDKLTERRVQIDFSNYELVCSDKILHLTEPSLPVPSWVCDAEKFSITAISNGVSAKLDGLIVKSDDSSVDISIIAQDSFLNELRKSKKIRIIAIDNTNIINSLETRFLQLEKDDDFDMNANLPSNIEFIYGPPGTGKTTELVKKVHNILTSEPEAKILVLTPTNKAADVVAIKMSNDDVCEGGLARYGATESLYLIEEIGCLTNRDTTDLEDFHNIVVATAARYAYDFVQPNDTAICDYPWDYIFIDEASMIDILTITYILYKGSSAKKIIISGDPKQIQPVVNNEMPAYNIYDMVDLHEFADAIFKYERYPVQGLMMQHRSIPSIGNLVSEFAYNGLVDYDNNRSPQKPLKLDGLNIRDINFIGFDVIDMDDIRGLISVNQSAFNLYSVLLTYNMIEYTIKQIEKHFPNNGYSIGAVCAYRAQSDALKNMLENRPLGTEYCSVSCGTVHSFQGDECDIMFIVLNPPAVCTSRTHVNNENIINVAMSRARDYIFFILPNGQQKGFFMKNKLGNAVSITDRSIINSKDVEKVMFNGDDNYICRNTHVTCHMPVNVYCEDNALYEVRYADNALDIKINQI